MFLFAEWIALSQSLITNVVLLSKHVSQDKRRVSINGRWEFDIFATRAEKMAFPPESIFGPTRPLVEPRIAELRTLLL